LQGYFCETEKPDQIEHEGVQVQVLALSCWSRLLLWPVFKLIWRKWTFPLARWLYVAAIRGQIAAACRGADVVHYLGSGVEMLGFAALSAAKKNGAIFVVDPAVHVGKWGEHWIDAQLFTEADLMFCYSCQEAEAIQKMGVAEEKIQKVPCGFDYSDSGGGEGFRKKHAISGPMVLFLGRKTMEKGVGRLLEAWPMVAEKFPEATLVIAGPKSEALRSMADGQWRMVNGEAASQPRTDVGERIADSNLPSTSYSPPLTAPEVPLLEAGCWTLDTGPKALNLDDLTEGEKQDALAACDMLCVPSEGESFGMVYFEAWAYKKPVVALDLPVLRESVGAANGGLLVQDTPSEIANGITKLLENPALGAVMGAKGKELASRHKWDTAVDAYLQTYTRIMATIDK
jgi:glycosyltransferase involved in cell wall biosynthesis